MADRVDEIGPVHGVAVEVGDAAIDQVEECWDELVEAKNWHWRPDTQGGRSAVAAIFRQKGFSLRAIGTVLAAGQQTIARDLALNQAHLASLRTSLRPRLLDSTLCDAQSHTRRLESAIRSAWQRHAEHH